MKQDLELTQADFCLYVFHGPLRKDARVFLMSGNGWGMVFMKGVLFLKSVVIMISEGVYEE